jgi:hypothetical protein
MKVSPTVRTAMQQVLDPGERKVLGRTVGRLKKDAAAASRALTRVLAPALGEEAAQPIVFYLSQLSAAAGHLRILIEQLGRVRPSNRPAIRRALLSIETQVYEVVERYKSQLKRPLTTTVKRLYAKGDGNRT